MTAVTLNNHAANRKAQSYAMRLSREKRIKEAAQLFRIKSRPRIFDRDDESRRYSGALFSPAAPDLDP